MLRFVCLLASVMLLAASCTSTGVKGAQDCTQAGECPKGLRCFPDWRCYQADAQPDCDPPCYGVEPYCDRATLRCAACLTDDHCAAGTVCAPGAQRCQPGCSAQHPECATAAERCDLALGICRGCSTDSECTTGANPRCDAPTGRCVPCLTDSDNCPAHQVCSGAAGSQSCISGCKTSSDCASDAGASLECCSGQCVDLTTDASHCGSCAGSCGNLSCCGGTCTNLSTNADHCAACGHSCYRPNVGGAGCTAGVCHDTGCEYLFGDCDGNPANGCETNLSYTAEHCSYCGHACTAPPHAAAACLLTICGVGTCEVGWGDCNTGSQDGCETNLLTDPMHCGTCLIQCGASQSCVSGQCT